MQGGDQYEITVVVSAIDPRGVFERVVRGWTQRQSLARDRYTVLVAGVVDAGQSAALAAHMGPTDRHVAPDERDSGTQWARGAAEARSPYLVFSEAHCLPAPGCLEAVLERFEETGADVLALSCPGTTGSTLEWLDERFCRGEFEHRPFAERAVSPRAFAIRRATYERVGGIDSQLGAFGDFDLARRVAAADVAIAAAPRAAVLHYNVPTLDQPVFCVADYVRGELSWRGRVPEAAAWDALGVRAGLAQVGNRNPAHQAAARHALRTAALHALVGARSLRRGIRSARGWARLAFVERARARRVARRLDAQVERLRDAVGAADRDAEGVAQYHAYWRALTEQRVERLIESGHAGLPEDAGCGVSTDGGVPSDRLFGFSVPIRDPDRWVRCIRGVAGVRLPPGPPQAGLRLTLRPGARSGPLLVLWNGRVAGRAPAGSPAFEVDGAGLSPAEEGAEDLLVLVDERNPVPKWDHAPRDGRDVVVLDIERPVDEERVAQPTGRGNPCYQVSPMRDTPSARAARLAQARSVRAGMGGAR